MKKIHCEQVCYDYIQAKTGEYDGVKKCSIDIHSDVDRIILDAAKIRKLRKQLKRALVDIEGDNGPKDTTHRADEPEAGGEGEAWIPKPGDRVKFVDKATLDVLDKCAWHPKVGEIYVVRHVYDDSMYAGFSLMETPDEKYTGLNHGYKFRASGFEPVA